MTRTIRLLAFGALIAVLVFAFSATAFAATGTMTPITISKAAAVGNTPRVAFVVTDPIAVAYCGWRFKYTNGATSFWATPTVKYATALVWDDYEGWCRGFDVTKATVSAPFNPATRATGTWTADLYLGLTKVATGTFDVNL